MRFVILRKGLSLLLLILLTVKKKRIHHSLQMHRNTRHYEDIKWEKLVNPIFLSFTQKIVNINLDIMFAILINKKKTNSAGFFSCIKNQSFYFFAFFTKTQRNIIYKIEQRGFTILIPFPRLFVWEFKNMANKCHRNIPTSMQIDLNRNHATAVLSSNWNDEMCSRVEQVRGGNYRSLPRFQQPLWITLGDVFGNGH